MSFRIDRKASLQCFWRFSAQNSCWNFFSDFLITRLVEETSLKMYINLLDSLFFSGIAYEALCIHFCMRMSKIQVHFQVQKVWRFWTSWPSSKNFSELKMIFNKFLLGLPPTKVNIDSELFSLGLTREMLTREMIKFCIHYIIARLYLIAIAIQEMNSQMNSTILI